MCIRDRTGTAQKIAPGGGYLANEYVASFIGIAPCTDPRLVVMVVVDAPKGYPYYGGWVAAPVAKEILKDSLHYLKVPIDGITEEEQARAHNQVVVPDVVNLPLADALSALNARGLKAKVQGNGNIVWQQTPRSSSKLERGSQVIIYLSPYDQQQKDSQVTVPDLQGKSMKEVARILADLGLHLVPEGHGLAEEQVPAPGKVVTRGSSIRVKFQSNP